MNMNRYKYEYIIQGIPVRRIRAYDCSDTANDVYSHNFDDKENSFENMSTMGPSECLGIYIYIYICICIYTCIFDREVDLLNRYIWIRTCCICICMYMYV
jgi:hypothetical protein